MKFTRLGGTVFCVLLQAILAFNAHSHSSQLTEDSDYLVLSFKETTGLVYSGRYYPRQPDNWKWITLDEYNSVRYRGKLLIYRYCSEYFQHRGHPNHHYNSSGRRTLTLESRRVYTHQLPRRPLCSSYRYIPLQRFQKLSLRHGSIHYVIYYTGKVEFHKNEKSDRKSENCVKPKTRVKRKQLEQHSRKRSCEKKGKFEPRKPEREKERSRPRRCCGVPSHNH